MKKITLLLTVAVFCLSVSAQEEEREIQTLFGNKGKKISHGGYGALMFGYTQIDKKNTYLFGIKGGWMINHHLTIGVAGYGFTDDIYYDHNNSTWNNSFAGGYGGLLIEPIIAPWAPVHVAFPVIIGAGGIGYYEPSNKDWNWNWDDEYYNNQLIDSDAYFLIEPGIEAEFNIVKFLRIGIGASYRWTSNVNMYYWKDNVKTYFDKNLMHGFSGNLSLKFGKF